METVFDHNITDKEQKVLLGYVTTRDKYPVAPRSQRWHHETLYDLYTIRGNKQMAQKYLDLMPDDIHKFFSTTNHDFAK